MVKQIGFPTKKNNLAVGKIRRGLPFCPDRYRDARRSFDKLRMTASHPTFACLLRRPRAAEALAEAQVAWLRRPKGYDGRSARKPSSYYFRT
jgi:hypothetical protein